MNKILFCLIIGVTTLTNVWAQDLNLIATCSNPRLLEGELQVSLSTNRKYAKVSLSGLIDFPTIVSSIGGPVISFDYLIGNQEERIIIAVDNGHELHRLNQEAKRFEKLGDLTCRYN